MNIEQYFTLSPELLHSLRLARDESSESERTRVDIQPIAMPAKRLSRFL